MPLHLISGLPNTGRTEKLREEFEAAAEAGLDPILLVPSVDDVFAWERRLTRADADTPESDGGRSDGRSAAGQGAGGFVGGRVMHFHDLCREIVRRADGEEPRIAGEMRRRLALDRAVEAVASGPAGPASRIEGKTEEQPGLLDAALELVDEYRAERIESGDPYRSGSERGEEGLPSGAVSALREGIEPLVNRFEQDLGEDGLTDVPQVADRALEVVVELVRKDRLWGSRPLFVAGFDDMTGQQLELLRKLSTEAGTEVRMAVTWEDDLGRGFLTDRLRSRLRDRVGVEGEDRVANPGTEEAPGAGLAGLSRAFIAGDPGELAENPPVTLIRAAGERREAEAIGAEVARLLASELALPDEIAIAHTDPASSGRLLEGILRRYGIPATLETETGALATKVGASLAALLRASSPDGTSGDLIIWLRGPLGPGRTEVDRIELECRRKGVVSATGALKEVEASDRGEWEGLLDGSVSGVGALQLIAELAGEAGRKILADAVIEGRTTEDGPERPDPEVELEVRMAETLADSARDLALAAGGTKTGAGLMLEAIRRGDVSVWTVPTKGTVRITGPWALRSKRVRYLFIAGLQEGGTRDLTRAGPFISTIERRALEMLERVDPEVQARYLMFSCLNVPTERLWLSCTTSDDSGKATAPSPLIAEIEALCPEPLPVIERAGSDVTLPPGLAPTVAELVRSLAAEGGEAGNVELDAETAQLVEKALARASALEERSREFGPIQDPGVREVLAKLESFSPSELEAWLACPWTWFIDRKVNPRPFKPEETYLISGTLVHAVLEKLYRDAPGERPEPGNLPAWLERVGPTFELTLAEYEGDLLSGDDPAVKLLRYNLEKMVRAFLSREAEVANPEFLPALLEQRFYRPRPGQDADPDALDQVEMDGWSLKGTIDRVDTRERIDPAAGVEALVIDYKTGAVGAEYSPAKLETYRRVQVPLYMEAVRRSLGLEPVAGFVLSLKEGGDHRPRGLIPAGDPEVVGTRGHFENDEVDSIAEAIGNALEVAERGVSGIRSGSLDHEPERCKPHFEDPDCLLPEPTPSTARPVVKEVLPEDEPGVRNGDSGESFPFSPEQERVIESRANEIMVTAAAGSGKTSVTVERYRRLLEDEGLEPDQILVFTFTEKAAAKLREEVRMARTGRAGEPVSMSDAWVGTFHSICSRILTAYPLEAGVDPGFTVIDDIRASTLRNQAFDRALRRRLAEAGDENDSLLAILTQIDQGTLKKAVFGTFNRLRSRGEEFPGLDIRVERPDYPEDDLADLADRIEAALERDDIPNFKEGSGYDHKGTCRKLLELIRSPRGGTISAAEIASFGFTNAALDRETKIPSSREAIKGTLHEIEGYPWLVEFDLLLRAFGQEYAVLKAGRSGLDFEDLQIKTLKMLAGNEDIRNEYGSRFEEIMVDEFQDTNQLQMKLIEALRGDGTTRLMTVGDEMQSIYGFRHSDVGIFRERTTRLRNGGAGCDLIELPRNYRSEPAIIETVNAIGATIHVAGDEDGAPAFTPLVAGRQEGTDRAVTTLLLTPGKGWKDADLGPLCPAGANLSESARAATAEALAVASHLRDLVDSGKCSQGDIAILLRSMTGLDFYLRALEQFGLRTIVPSSKGFWASRPVRQLISLLSIVANPLDDRAMTAALTSPACGVGPDGLWKIREAAGTHGPLWLGVEAIAQGQLESDVNPDSTLGPGLAGDLEAITALHRAVCRVRAELDRVPLESVVTGLLDDTGLDLAWLLRDRASLASLERVATLAGEYESQEGRDLRGFLDWAESSRQVDAEAAISTSSENDDAVKIMTIHKAKGLEFPVVCVPDLGRELGQGLEGPVVFDFGGEGEAMRIGLRIPRSDQGVFDWLSIEPGAERDTEAEELRLIHVAMTRAERRLILSGQVRPDGKGNEFRLPAINRILKPYGLDLVDPTTWAEAIEDSGRSEALDVELNLPEDVATRESLVRSFPLVIQTRPVRSEAPPLARPDRAFFPDVPLSFSGLLEFGECPARFFARRVLRMDVESSGTPWGGPDTTGLTERDGGTKFGTAVHDLLEPMPSEGWSLPSPERAERALEAVGISSEEAGVQARAIELIEGFVESGTGKRAQAAGDGAAAEVPIVLGIGGLTIRGFIDLLVTDEAGVLVVDYKTNRLDGRAPEDLMGTYSLQRDLYSLAVARARGLDRIEASFVFLEAPDRPVEMSLGPADLVAIEERLRKEVVGPIIGARYFGGPGDGPDPCGSCPACEILGLA